MSFPRLHYRPISHRMSMTDRRKSFIGKTINSELVTPTFWIRLSTTTNKNSNAITFSIQFFQFRSTSKTWQKRCKSSWQSSYVRVFCGDCSDLQYLRSWTAIPLCLDMAVIFTEQISFLYLLTLTELLRSKVYLINFLENYTVSRFWVISLLHVGRIKQTTCINIDRSAWHVHPCKTLLLSQGKSGNTWTESALFRRIKERTSALKQAKNDY